MMYDVYDVKNEDALEDSTVEYGNGFDFICTRWLKVAQVGATVL